MAAKTVSGKRIAVKLPFDGATKNDPQYVYMKGPVAKLLNFPVAKSSDLFYKVKINKKDDGPGPEGDVPGTTTIDRPRRPGYRQRSFKVIFDKPKIPINNKKSFNSVSFPVTRSVAVADVIKYFESQGGSNVGVTHLVTDLGASYSINPKL